jgi:hypothetical protein
MLFKPTEVKQPDNRDFIVYSPDGEQYKLKEQNKQFVIVVNLRTQEPKIVSRKDTKDWKIEYMKKIYLSRFFHVKKNWRNWKSFVKSNKSILGFFTAGIKIIFSIPILVASTIILGTIGILTKKPKNGTVL